MNLRRSPDRLTGRTLKDRRPKAGGPDRKRRVKQTAARTRPGKHQRIAWKEDKKEQGIRAAQANGKPKDTNPDTRYQTEEAFRR